MTSATKSPFVVGLWRPTVVLPRMLVERLTARELRLVLLHELAHLRRRDLEVRWIMLVLRAVHWFNPLVWLALSRMHIACELACDQDVLKYSQRTSPADYSRTILKVVETLSANKFLDPLLTPSEGFFQRGSSVKERLTMLSKMSPARNREWQTILGAALLVILPASAFTQAVEQNSDTEVPPQRDAQPDKPAAPQPAHLAGEQIDGWIKQLGDDDYHTREQATKKLTEAGADAVGPLEKAAKQTDDAEVRSRAERALSFFFKGADRPLSQAAAKALARIHPDRNDEFQRQPADRLRGPTTGLEAIHAARARAIKDAQLRLAIEARRAAEIEAIERAAEDVRGARRAAAIEAARALEIEAARRAEENVRRAIDTKHAADALQRRLAIEAARAAEIEAVQEAAEGDARRRAIDAERAVIELQRRLAIEAARAAEVEAARQAAEEDVRRVIEERRAAAFQQAKPQRDVQSDKPAAPQRTQVAAEQIDGWIKQLGADDFHTREQATKKLTEAGVDAVGALEKAAKQTDDAEARIRAEGILTSFFKGADRSLSQAAGEALAKIHPDRKGEFQRRPAAARRRPLLGVALEDGDGGARITAVMPDSGAEKAGVQIDDIVLSVNGTKIEDRAAMAGEVHKHKSGDKVTLKIKRGDDELELTAKLGGEDRPAPEGEADFRRLEELRRSVEALQRAIEAQQRDGP